MRDIMSRNKDRGLGTGKTIIGILGGMGPRATWAFCEALTREFSFDREREHPRIIVDCNTQIPSRTAAVFGDGPSPVPGSVESINGLVKLGATIIAAPCNQIYYWHEEISSQITVLWPNMIEIVGITLAEAGMKKVLILGGPVTAQRRIYSKYLPDAIYPDESLQESIRLKIEVTKRGQGGGRVDDLIGDFVLYRPDSVLLACTELDVSAAWVDWIHSSLRIYAHEIAEMVKND